LLLPDDDTDVGQGWGTNILIRVAKADILVKETTARQKREEKKFGEYVCEHFLSIREINMADVKHCTTSPINDFEGFLHIFYCGIID
jgi:hypothetical protein